MGFSRLLPALALRLAREQVPARQAMPGLPFRTGSPSTAALPVQVPPPLRWLDAPPGWLSNWAQMKPALTVPWPLERCLLKPSWLGLPGSLPLLVPALPWLQLAQRAVQVVSR